MHVQLDPDNAAKFQKASNNTLRSVGELVNAALRAIDEMEYVEKLTTTMKKLPEDPPQKKRIFKHQRSWINRY